MELFDKLRLKSKTSLNDTDLAADNEQTDKRNVIISASIFVSILLMWSIFYLVTRPSAPPIAMKAPEFGAVVTPDFGIKDTQSALQSQQQEVTQLKSDLEKMTRNNASLKAKFDDSIARMTDMLSRAKTRSEEQMNNMLDNMEIQMQEQAVAFEQKAAQLAAASNSVRAPFGSNQYATGETPSSTGDSESSTTGGMATPASLEPLGIQTFTYQYPDNKTTTPYKRTSENYVPSGSFVTAVLTGAADANAGVNAQGDTAPITFRTIHEGILPNGKRSRLKGCFVTASVYGEISSNRGIARLNNLSCIFNDKIKGEEILDIPVQGTAFNFGRNGIRGTPVMRNGKIMQMAGISGLFTGLGNTAKNASSTQVTGPAGVVSSVNPSQALMNMGGSALENVGSKMADYYIKLAEQYHPIIELNPGAVVNLVFLQGFPLDADKLADYEAKLYGENATNNMTQTLMSTYLNPLTMLPNQNAAPTPEPPAPAINPLIGQLPDALRAQAQQQYNAQAQSNPF
ncbi:TrbI/VirB10 family protein [Aliivibrio fischeri]|uniref:Conjugal transfer protein TraB n=1 Tax=Aliivibrio fischeri TaxID=668 RepID=A0A844P4U1_ALIFS|nr:TrbI/VirB10 family protein [Aliivibrio fischeri]MUK51123.1 conjugal transfer protein TraB [Aliivibrio fischeri]